MSSATATSSDADDRDGAQARPPSGRQGRAKPSKKASGTPEGLPRSVTGGYNPWLIALVLSIATFMETLDSAIANVALRYIAGDLAVSNDESTWVLTSYLVSNAVVLPISGWLANVFGRKRFYMTCVALFTLGSLACGLATSLPMLICCRVLQGIGGGGLAPSEQSMLTDSFTPAKRGTAFALYGIAVVVAPAVGPVLGGYICDNYSWHWIFLINIPIGIVSLVLVHFLLTEPPLEEQERKARVKKGISVDYVGFGLVALGLGCLQVALDRGERKDWFQSSFIVAFTVIAVVSLIVLIPWELTRKQPIVNLSLYANKSFVAGSVLMLVLGFILLGTTQLLPQMVQDLFSYTATSAGMVLTPGGFALMLLMPVVGFLVSRWQARLLIAIGLVIEFFALWHMSTFTLDVSYAQLAWARVFQSAGLAFLFVPITNAAYSGLKPGQSNDASALINLMRNLGGAFGVSLTSAFILDRTQYHQSQLVETASGTNPFYRQTLNQIATDFSHRGIPSAATQSTAVQQIGSIINQQSEFISYIEVFRCLAWFALFAVPLVFLLKKTKKGEAPAAA